jgi:hypothetical protein
MRGGILVAALAAAALPAALGACSGGEALAPIACPTPSIPSDAADLTRYRPGPVRDLTTLEFDAQMTGLQGGCRPGRDGRSIDLTLTLGFGVDRGAAAQGRAVELPWTVAVVDGRTEEPLGRPRRFVDTFVFAPNETRSAGSGQPVTISLPVGGERRAQDYRILVFFQLTEEELALNRRRGPR